MPNSVAAQFALLSIVSIANLAAYANHVAIVHRLDTAACSAAQHLAGIDSELSLVRWSLTLNEDALADWSDVWGDYAGSLVRQFSANVQERRSELEALLQERGAACQVCDAIDNERIAQEDAFLA